MSLFDVIAILLTLAALLSYVNQWTLRLPNTIGVMLIALLLSLAVIVAHGAGWDARLGVDIQLWAERLLESVDFDDTLLRGMLAFLLFAGALHVELNDLARQKVLIGLLASVSLILSTLLVGGVMYGLLSLLGVPVPFVYALLFGALIAPTDPVAVLGILKSAGVPPSLQAKITGESLFNDGVGVVVFLVLLEVATGSHEVGVADVAGLFAQETFGGAAFGMAAGLLAYLMLRSLDNYQVEILITLALVTGTYALAGALHLSGPIAIVVAGLLIGNHGRSLAMSERTREHLDTFWELVDEVLNAVLFALIGLEVLVIGFAGSALIAGVLAIPVVLLARFVAVSLPVRLLRPFRSFTPGVVRMLTWAGLRGGISVALALSLPKGPERDILLSVTYCVVVFSIVVQGLTVAPLARRMVPADEESEEVPSG